MADARAKAVLGALADLSSVSNYVADLATSLREPIKMGDSIDVPSISDLTVGSGVDGNLAAQDVSVQSVTTNVLTLTANLCPVVFAEIPSLESVQNLDGNWAPQVAQQAMVMLKNDIDSTFCKYLTNTVAYDASATYHFNVAADAFARADFLNAKAYLLSQKGCMPQNLKFVVHPFGEGSISALSEFVPNYQAAEQGVMGIPRLGFLYGVPVYMSNSIQRSRSVACTAVSISSNVATVTVASGHGLVPGMKVTISGITTPLTTAAAIASVASTSFTVPLSAGDGAMGDGVGTVTATSADNLLFDSSQVFTAIQQMPAARIVPFHNRTSDALQISAIWGRLARQGRVAVVHTPATSVS